MLSSTLPWQLVNQQLPIITLRQIIRNSVFRNKMCIMSNNLNNYEEFISEEIKMKTKFEPEKCNYYYSCLVRINTN